MPTNTRSASHRLPPAHDPVVRNANATPSTAAMNASPRLCLQYERMSSVVTLAPCASVYACS